MVDLEGILNQFEFTHEIDAFELSTNGEGNSRGGDGGFSSVDIYKHKKLGVVAIKKITISNNGNNLEMKSIIKSFVREVKALQRLSHENIVKFYGTTRVSDGVVGIIMEYVDGTSLQCLLKKQGSKLPWIVRLWILYQISKALKRLHRYKKNKWLVHSDLKPENIMITDDWKVKLIDFGSINFGKIEAASQDSLDEIKSDQRTDFYAAPEILVCGDVARTPDIDIYSYGMVIYEVLTSIEVYSDATCTRDYVIVKIKNGEERPNAKNLDKVESTVQGTDKVIFGYLRSLAQQCWEQDPRNRPSIEEVNQILKETLHEIAGENFKESRLQTLVDQALLSMELKALKNSTSEKIFAHLTGKISSQPALEDRDYDVIDDVAIFFLDRGINSCTLLDIQKAFDLWSSVPDKRKAKHGVQKCQNHLQKSYTEFLWQVESLVQRAQKETGCNYRPMSSESERNSMMKADIDETSLKLVRKKMQKGKGIKVFISENAVLLVEQPENLDETKK